MYHHAVARIYPYMADRRTAVIRPREKDNVPRLGFAWCYGRCVIENTLRRCPAYTPCAGMVDYPTHKARTVKGSGRGAAAPYIGVA